MTRYTPLLAIIVLFLFATLVVQNYGKIFGSYAVCNFINQDWGQEAYCKQYPNLYGTLTGFAGVSQNNTTVSNVTIGTVAPTIGDVILEDNESVTDDIITLWGGMQRPIFCNATVNDLNGGSNFNTTVPNATIYDDSSTDYGVACNARTLGTWNNTVCYLAPNSTYTSNCSWGRVINSTANALNCTIGDSGGSGGMWYTANSTRSQTANQRWNCTINVTDSDSNTSYGSDIANVSELLAVGTPTLLDFGTLALGATSNEYNATNITNYGNVKIAFYLNGTDMADMNEPPGTCTGTGFVPVGLEKYNCTNYSQTYDTLMANLTKTPSGTSCTGVRGFNLSKSVTVQGTPALSQKNMSWKVSVPGSGVSGQCLGKIWFVAVSSYP
jgi:hypothetical protein